MQNKRAGVFMDIEIREKKENKLLGRQQVSCKISFEKQLPSRKEVREALCAALGVAPEVLVVQSVRGGFGVKSAKAIVHVYKDAQAAKAASRHLLVRDGLEQKKEKKKAEKKAPAKK